MIDAGQFDRFGVVAPQPSDQRLNRGIEIKDQAAGVGIAHHALQPEERRDPGAAGLPASPYVDLSRINYQMSGRELDFVATVEGSSTMEFAAVVVFRLDKTTRPRDRCGCAGR